MCSYATVIRYSCLAQLMVTLDVNSNKLKDLVPDIRQLRTLEVLDVSSNQFQTLAKQLDYLYTLRRLNVANNQFVRRSSVIELTRLIIATDPARR